MAGFRRNRVAPLMRSERRATPPAGTAPHRGVNTNSACHSGPRGVNTNTLTGMTRRQIPRGTRTASARVSLVVEEEKKDRFAVIAKQSGLSGAALFEALVDHLETELTDRGVPAWLSQPEPHDGELPIVVA